MVEERPKRRRKKGKVRAKKAQPKKTQPKKTQPVLKEEQLPGLLEGEIPRGVPVTEEEAAGEEEPWAVAEEAAEEKRPPVVAEKQAVSAEAIKVAVSARAPKPGKRPERRAVLAEKLMNVPEFRQRVVKLVVQKFS